MNDKITSNLHVGSTVFVCLPGTRYHQWKWKWEPRKIVGETTRSWIVEIESWQKLKFPKKPDPKYGYRTQPERRGYDSGYQVLLTQAEVGDSEYVNTHAWRIADRVKVCRDADVLRKIAALVGYEDGSAGT